MLAHAHFLKNQLSDSDLFVRIHTELVNRYDVDEKLANEMAWDLIEVLSAIDGNISIFEKYFLQ
jgi:hypothetical protein